MNFSGFGSGLCAAALVCAVSGVFTGETPSGRAAKTCAGLFLACCLLSPLGGLLRKARRIPDNLSVSAADIAQNADCEFLCALVECRTADLLAEHGCDAARAEAALGESGISLTVCGVPEQQQGGAGILLWDEFGIMPEFQNLEGDA